MSNSLVSQSDLFNKESLIIKLSKTGATVELRELTGALLRKRKTSMRELRDNKDSCSFKRRRRIGAIEEFTLMSGAIRRSRELKTSRLLMINHFMRDQPRLPGNSKEQLLPLHRSQDLPH